jgi:hypothetical protein
LSNEEVKTKKNEWEKAMGAAMLSQIASIYGERSSRQNMYDSTTA